MRRIYLIASLAAHAVLLSLLYYTGSYQPTLAAQERQVYASRQLDSHAAMRKRVADMERIKELMRESVGESDGTAPEKVRFDATTTEEQGDLLAQAEALAKEIDAIGERARVDEYAKLAGVDREQAAKQLASPAQQEPAPGQAAGQAPEQGQGGAGPADSGAGVAARVAALEQHAREVLAQRQRQLEQAQQGVQVGGAAPAGQGPQGARTQGVAGRIAAFVNRDLAQLVPDGGGSYRGGGGGDMFDHGTGRMANVDQDAMRKGTGRKLGAGGEFANRVYVNSWYLIGPFAGKHGAGMFANGSYPPEQAVVLDAAYRGKDDRFLTWRYVESPTYPLVPRDQAEDSVYFGYTELMMDSERELTMWIGADDDVQVWLNDRLVWKGGNVNKLWFFQQVYETSNDYAATYNLNEGKVLVHFRKGRNKLFFKLSNGPNKCFLSMVLTPA